MRRNRPRAAGRVWRAVAGSAGFPYGTTNPAIVRGLLQRRVGEPCTELRRAESERVLRAQPFRAAARVRAVADADGVLRGHESGNTVACAPLRVPAAR
jgi:cysteine synthase